MAEWSKAAVSKTVNPHPGILGFESPSLRSMQSSKCAALSAAFFVKQDRQKLVFCKVPASQKNGLVVLHSAALLPDKRGNGRLCGQIPHLLLSLMIPGEKIHPKNLQNNLVYKINLFIFASGEWTCLIARGRGAIPVNGHSRVLSLLKERLEKWKTLQLKTVCA